MKPYHLRSTPRLDGMAWIDKLTIIAAFILFALMVAPAVFYG